MSNTISITACDNEVFIIAYTPDCSYVLAHLNSGYNYPVNVSVTIESGEYTQVPYLNGQGGALNQSYTAYLPAGTYSITAVCVNWGGPWAYAYSLNGGSIYSQSAPSGVGSISAGPGLTVSAASAQAATIIFSGLTPGGSTNSYTESGYNLSGTNIYASEYNLTPPGKAAFPSSTSTIFTLQRSDGTTFALKSVDLRNLNSQVPSQNLVFTGYVAGGGTVSHTIQTDNQNSGYRTDTFPSNFSNLTSVVWTPSLTCITNVKVNN